MTESSKLREKFGVSKTAIKADRAFKKPLQHFQDMGVDGLAWILLDTAGGTRVNANTYNGNAGKNSNPKTFDIPTEEKAFNTMIKGYTEVPVSECPITITGAVPTEDDADPASDDAE